MEENFVGYLLDALDPETKVEVEKYLDEEPGARQRLDVLRRALVPLEADKDAIDPPSGLVIRTLGRVAEYRCRPLPQAPPPAPARIAPVGRSWWRRADILAAACLFLVLGGVGAPWLAGRRAEARKIECQDNLRVFHGAIKDYTDNNNNDLPHLRKDNPRHIAEAFVPLLRARMAGLPEKLSVTCPACGPRHSEIPSFDDLEKLSDEAFAEKMRTLSQMPGCYAFPLGYQQQGKYYPPHFPLDLINVSVMPVMADGPSIPGPDGEVRGNSPNHHGQNVLFFGGNVRFCKSPQNPYIAGDNLFLNNEGKVAAGVDPWDTVFGCHEDRP